ncbi:acyl-CoA dehydrogenase family protein [Streptomyces scopuliridis]|uniref:acyl-CoA dehydrogenase family protein n=1 Tax=Streptomyces scopuliridis TaxID=452529 RepID=UPI0036B89F43
MGGPTTAAERAADLERRFGAPGDPDNPLGADRVLAADDARVLLPEAERMLDDFGLAAEFVPASLGGRLESLDGLARVARTVFRHDPALGAGYGLTAFPAAVAVWLAGAPEQRHGTARRLLDGGRICAAYPEPTRGNAFLRNDFTAVRDGDGFVLDGGKTAFNNVARAGSLVVFARTNGQETSTSTNSGSGSAFLLDLQDLPPDGFRMLPRRATVGLPGCSIGGIEFLDCPVPSTALLGGFGDGTALAAHATLITRAVQPSMTLGCADTALRTAVAFASASRAGRRSRLRTPRVDTVLTGAFADLLMCDSLALAASRAAHLRPRASIVYSAVTQYLLPRVLTETVQSLSAVLGSESYATGGTLGLFRRTVRDLPMIGLGHAGSAVCLADVVARLPELSGAWRGGDEAPAALFRTEPGPLPSCFGPPPHAAAPPGDPLAATVRAAAAEWADSGRADGRLLAVLTRALAAELERLRAWCAGAHPTDPARHGAPGYAVADRYATVLAGAACLGVRRHRSPGEDPFLDDPAWLVTVLARVLRRLGVPSPAPGSGIRDRLLGEVVSRFDGARGYDLYATRVSV